MKNKGLEEQPSNAPILVRGRPIRVRGSSPIWARKLAWRIRQYPRAAAEQHYFLIQPNGHENILRPSEENRH